MPTAAMNAIPATPKAKRRAARIPSAAPSSAEATRMSAIRNGLSVVPRFWITARSTQPGVRSMTSSPTAITCERAPDIAAATSS